MAVSVGVSVGVGVVGVGVGVGVVGVGVGVVGVAVGCVAVDGSCGVPVGVEPGEAQLVAAISIRVRASTARQPTNSTGRRLRARRPAFPPPIGRWYRFI